MKNMYHGRKQPTLVISLILKVDIGQPREIPKIGVDLKVVKGGDCYRG